MSKSVVINWRQRGLEKARKSAATTKKLLLEAARGIKDVAARRAAVGQIRSDDRAERGRLDAQARRLRLQARAGRLESGAVGFSALDQGAAGTERARSAYMAFDGLLSADVSSPSTVMGSIGGVAQFLPGAGPIVAAVTGVLGRMFKEWEDKEERRRRDREKALEARLTRQFEARRRELDVNVRRANLQAARRQIAEGNRRYVRPR